MTETLLSGELTTGTTNHPDPMFDFLTGFVPRKLKDLFRWTEYLFYNSPHIFAALKKLSDYVITNITITTESDTAREQYEDLLLRSLKLKEFLQSVSRDRDVYGNSFCSIYFPFKRMMPCKSCKSVTDVRSLDSYEYSVKKECFKYECIHCGHKNKTSLDDVREEKVLTRKRINLIRWDPKLIDIDHNPITGESVYYYNIPQSVKRKVDENDRLTIDTMPKDFLRACKKDHIFRFQPGKIYHMKVDAPAGVNEAWGFPPLTSLMKQFYYTQVLRKANEAIALDHLVPFRVLHPAQTSGANDPVQSLNMQNWVSHTKKSLKNWRRDPLHIQFSPVALGVTQMGGQGRTLLTLGEVKEAEENIIMGLGVPREFLFGGLSFTGSSVTLRMLENQLTSKKADLVELAQWIANEICVYMNWVKVSVDIVPFRFIDDIQNKQMLLGADSTYNIVSRRTVSEHFDIDFDEEQEQIVQEQLEDVKRQTKLQRDIEEYQTSLAEQASRQGMNGGSGLNYDQQVVISEADAMVSELMNVGEGQRRSILSSLQAEDYVMYSVVIQRLEEARLQQKNQAYYQQGG